jgi:hypothetical protein
MRMLSKMAIFGSGAVMFAGVALANGTGVGSCDGGSCGMGGFVGNTDTGYNSYNRAELRDTTEIDVNNENDYDVNNDIDATVKTGYNTISGSNRGDGHWFWDNDRHCWSWRDSDRGEASINTGDAKANISVENKGNSNYTEVRSGAKSGTTVVNDMTGAHSENRASAYIRNEIDVDNENRADVDNNIDVTASTGNNSVRFNTGDASITTGNADVSVSVKNDLNSNYTVIK